MTVTGICPPAAVGRSHHETLAAAWAWRREIRRSARTLSGIWSGRRPFRSGDQVPGGVAPGAGQFGELPGPAV